MNLIINFRKKKLMKTKADMMKNIVFSKLWKYGAYCKVESVLFPKQKVWKGLHESIVDKLRNKLSKIERHYQLQ